MMAKENVLDCVGFSFGFVDLIITAPDKILPFRVSLSNANGILAMVIANTKNHTLGSFSLEFILET